MNDDRFFLSILLSHDMNQSAHKTGVPAWKQWVKLRWAAMMIHWIVWFKELQYLAQRKLIKLSSGGVSLLLGSKNQPADDDDGSATQWDNFQVCERGISFLFIQKPGADNRALMTGSWLQVTSAEHSGMFHSLIKNKIMAAAVYALISRLMFITSSFDNFCQISILV